MLAAFGGRGEIFGAEVIFGFENGLVAETKKRL